MRKALFILSDLADKDLLWLVEAGSYRSHPAGTRLIEAGIAVESLYIVIDGELDVILPPDEKIGRLGPGDLIGEMSLVEKRAPLTSVVTVSHCRLLTVPHDVLQRRLRQETDFAARFYRVLSLLLTDRLRSLTIRNRADKSMMDTQADFEWENELDEAVLDQVHVAGDRMRRLIGLLEGVGM